MRLLRFALVGALAVVSSQAQADVILFEDFEDATITYTSTPADDLSDIANKDYFGRIAPDTMTPPADVSFTNLQGSGYYGAQDTDGTPSGNFDLITLDWAGIDISSHTGLGLSWFVAEDDSNDGNEDWDSTSSFRILTQTNGGGFQLLFAIESELDAGDQTNEVPRVDTDFDGIGDGAEITDVFTQYSALLGNGSTLDIRVEIEQLNAGDEDIAFDSLLLTGDRVPSSDPIPEPTSGLLFSLGSLLVAGAIRRS